MSDFIIFNLIPTYHEAPVSSEIFSQHSVQILDALKANQTQKKYIVFNKENKITQGFLQELESIDNLVLVPVKETDGFVYGNKTSLLKVIKGEKPQPTGSETNVPVYSLEELLKTDTKTIFIGGNAKNKGVYVFSKTVTPREILEKSGSQKEFKGMYFGYPMGKMISSGQLDEPVELTTDYVRIYDETDCMLNQLVKIVERYLGESCGRCVYGYEGITQINLILTEMSQKKSKLQEVELLKDLCSVMKTQTLCDIGTAAATTVESALLNFKEEIEEHITKKTCKAVVCDKFVTYHILPDLCIGCSGCMDVCNDDAILGKKKFIHVIDQDECIQCGACLGACQQGAIVKAGAIKPAGPKSPIPCK